MNNANLEICSGRTSKNINSNMADMSQLYIDQIIRVFRDIVKRKINYNETNLHYEYFERAGDTIPFKTYGYQTLREFIEKNAGEFFYFGEYGSKSVYIAPRRSVKNGENTGENMDGDSKSVTSGNENFPKDSGNLAQGHGNLLQADGNENKSLVPFQDAMKLQSTQINQNKAKKRTKYVSESMHFMEPHSTGLCNPFQYVRNDIRVYVDFNTKQREIDHLPIADAEMKSIDGSSTLPGSSKMLFPWHQRYWHLKVVHVVSMNEIWARFYDEFEERMRTMTSRLIATSKQHPEHIRSTKVYYACGNDNRYYRIQIIRFEAETDLYKCFLCDVGSTKWYDRDQIYHCPSDIRHIAPMAIRFSLHELTAFKESRKACELVVSELSEKYVWAKIKITEEEYRKNKPRSIPAILYDLNDKNRRTNISSIITNKLMATFSAPKLFLKRTNYVKISHISKTTGIIYGHVTYTMNDLRFINDMIRAKVKAKPKISYTQANSDAALQATIAEDPSKLYLVYSKCDRCWYRATILELETDFTKSNDLKECSAFCFLVDYGLTRLIPFIDICELNGILSIYPYFAVAMLLENVQVAADTIEQLKSILLPDNDVMVDVERIIDTPKSNKSKCVTVVRMHQLRKYNDTTQMCDISEMITNRMMKS